jgi:hypothetical protein
MQHGKTVLEVRCGGYEGDAARKNRARSMAAGWRGDAARKNRARGTAAGAQGERSTEKPLGRRDPLKF